jgi:hypothetical protein
MCIIIIIIIIITFEYSLCENNSVDKNIALEQLSFRNKYWI